MSAEPFPRAPSAVHRKIGAAARRAAAAEPAVLRAWRLALIKGLSEAAGLPAALAGSSLAEVTAPEREGLPEPGDLVALLEHPDGRLGLALVGGELVAAAIEAQTMGRVLPRQAEPRQPTITDATMLADVLDRVLALYEAEASSVEDAHGLGFRYATRLADGRAAALALADASHAVRRFDLRLGVGTERVGALRIVLPLEDRASERDPEAWRSGLEAAVLQAEVTLEAELCRLPLALSQALQLAAGDVLTLPREALAAVRLTAPGGAVAGRGRLGQSGGHRAIRLEPAAAASGPPPWSPPGLTHDP